MGLLGGDLVSMGLSDALFAHWDVAPAAVAERLPASVDVATRDGRAWLGVVCLEMTDVRPRGFPVGRTFGQVNLRTYVERDGRRGVYFLTLDAADRAGVTLARRLFRLPYYRASVDVERREGSVRFASRRTHRGAPPARVDAVYRPVGATGEADADSLAAFLLENYTFFTAGGGGLYRGDISHDPWPLRPAELDLRAATLFEAAGLERPAGDPLVHFSKGCTATAGSVRRVD